jgi:hypothetical protein
MKVERLVEDGRVFFLVGGERITEEESWTLRDALGARSCTIPGCLKMGEHLAPLTYETKAEHAADYAFCAQHMSGLVAAMEAAVEVPLAAFRVAYKASCAAEWHVNQTRLNAEHDWLVAVGLRKQGETPPEL